MSRHRDTEAAKPCAATDRDRYRAARKIWDASRQTLSLAQLAAAAQIPRSTAQRWVRAWRADDLAAPQPTPEAPDALSVPFPCDGGASVAAPLDGLRAARTPTEVRAELAAVVGEMIAALVGVVRNPEAPLSLRTSTAIRVLEFAGLSVPKRIAPDPPAKKQDRGVGALDGATSAAVRKALGLQ